MPLFNADAYLNHTTKVMREIFKLTNEGRPFKSSDWQNDEPDLFAQLPEQIIDVKTIREATQSATISARQLEHHYKNYGEIFNYAMWSEKGRLELTPDEVLELAGHTARRGREGRGDYYLIDLSGREWQDPFAMNRRHRGPDRQDGDMQITLDGREVRQAAIWTPGKIQSVVIDQLRLIGAMMSYEVGFAIHQARGYCTISPSRQGKTRELRLGECCVQAVDDGASLMAKLRDQGRAWKSESSGYWRLYTDEEWKSDAA